MKRHQSERQYFLFCWIVFLNKNWCLFSGFSLLLFKNSVYLWPTARSSRSTWRGETLGFLTDLFFPNTSESSSLFKSGHPNPHLSCKFCFHHFADTKGFCKGVKYGSLDSWHFTKDCYKWLLWIQREKLSSQPNAEGIIIYSWFTKELNYHTRYMDGYVPNSLLQVLSMVFQLSGSCKPLSKERQDRIFLMVFWVSFEKIKY